MLNNEQQIYNIEVIRKIRMQTLQEKCRKIQSLKFSSVPFILVSKIINCTNNQ